MDKIYSKSLVFFIVLSLADSHYIQASHIVGGEIYYEQIQNNEYVIYLNLYRDCSESDNAGFDSTLYISLYNVDNEFIDTILLDIPIIQEILPEVNNPCLSVPDHLCLQEAKYSKHITLPQLSGGHTLSYQTCCRNATISNISNPDAAGATFTIHIPDPAISNTSPEFINFPPVVICTNEPLYFDFSANDKDGDSLVYEFVTPYSGYITYSISDPPPYNSISWLAPYSLSYPLSANPGLAIDPHSGILSGTPNLSGQFVIAVAVSEYRDGAWLSTIRRDFQLNSVVCTSAKIDISVKASEICNATKLSFSRTAIYTDDLVLYLEFQDSSSELNQFLPDSIILEAGQSTLQLTIPTYDPNFYEFIDGMVISSNMDTFCSTIISSQYSVLEPEPVSLKTSNTNLVICKDEVATLSVAAYGGESPYRYLWSTNETESSIQVNPNQTSSYSVLVTDSCGEQSKKEITVYVICEVEIPTIFTPNGDGLNDVFYIVNMEQHPNSKLEIYDSWGRLVISYDNYSNHWNGENLREGTYYYVLSLPQYQTYSANRKAGFVTLLRK